MMIYMVFLMEGLNVMNLLVGLRFAHHEVFQSRQ